MVYRLVFTETAQADVDDLYARIAEKAGPSVAQAYIDRIEAYCAGFTTFPERVVTHSEIRPGLRTIGFERRVTIAFVVKGDDIVILRVLYGGRSIERAFADEGLASAEFPKFALKPPPSHGARRLGQPSRGVPHDRRFHERHSAAASDRRPMARRLRRLTLRRDRSCDGRDDRQRRQRNE
jgi:toxin ParE1/3/4